MSDHLPVIMDIEIDADPSVSVKQLAGHVEVNIYPNPVQNTLHILLKSSVKSYTEISLLDMMGQTLIHNMIGDFSNDKQLSIDMNDLPNGLYFVKVQTDDQFMIRKVIKAK